MIECLLLAFVVLSAFGFSNEARVRGRIPLVVAFPFVQACQILVMMAVGFCRCMHFAASIRCLRGAGEVFVCPCISQVQKMNFIYRWAVVAFSLTVSLAASAIDISLVKEDESRMVVCDVRGGQVVTISGKVVCGGLSKSFCNAVVFSLRFIDRNGLPLSSGTLPEDDRHNGIFYANGNAEPCCFSKTLPVPDGACRMEVLPSALWTGGSCDIRDLKLDLVEQARYLGDAFSWHWWSVRLAEWMSTGMSPASLGFCGFVIILLVLYFLFPIAQPWILLLGSVVFYSMFNLRAWCFLGASVLSIYIGGRLVAALRFPRLITGFVVCFNLGLLVLAKYGAIVFHGTSIIVPLGVSFYTLQAVSYMVDIGRGTIKAENNFFKLTLYLIYFPSIMQGPISRYDQLGSQLWTRHVLNLEHVRDGMQLALWGAFKKMVIADRAALVVDKVFDPGSQYEGLAVIFAVVVYSIQIYADFSGCVDISRGVSQCLGIDLIRNFNHPYFAESVQDFWRRWHISLSLWLRDYVYIPLGGNRHGAIRKYLNILVVFAVSGLWHGTGMNFLVWGLLYGVFQIVDALRLKIDMAIHNVIGVDNNLFSCRLGRTIVTFAEVSFAWIFFRAKDCSHAWSIVRRMKSFAPGQLFDGSLLSLGLDGKDYIVLLFSICLLLAVSSMQVRLSVREFVNRQTLAFRWGISLTGIVMLLTFGMYGVGYNPVQFIYMQF